MATKKRAGAKRPAAKQQARKGSSSAAGEYVREEMHEFQKGKLKSPQQAIAIGLSRARREGEDVAPPKPGRTSAATRKKAQQDAKAGANKKQATKTGAKKKAVAKKRTAAKR